MLPQRSLAFGETCPQAQNEGEGRVLLAYRSLGKAGTLFENTTREIICSRFWRINAHAEPVRVSQNPTTVITANGEVQTNEEAPVYVHDLDLFVTMQLLEDTPAVWSLGKLCEEHCYAYEWPSGQKRGTISVAHSTKEFTFTHGSWRP